MTLLPIIAAVALLVLLIALLNGLFYLSDRPFSVLGIFAINFAVFLAVWMVTGALPDRMPMERMSLVGLVSVASATLYMAWVAIYYGLLLASESALQREVLRHRNTAERLLAAKDKAEKANKDKSIFLAKMSHELRTPLNAVIGYSEILLEDCEPAADAQRHKDLGRINAAGKHLLSLVADVLDSSRIEANADALSSLNSNSASDSNSASNSAIRPGASRSPECTDTSPSADCP